MKYILLSIITLVYSSVFGQIQDNTDIRIFPSDVHQSEVHISVNKRFPNIILVSSNVAPNDDGSESFQGFYFSLDGGQNWDGNDEMPDGSPAAGDPVTAFDADGNFHIVTMTREADGYFVFSSTDDGLTWDRERGTGPGGFFDKEMAVFFDDQQGTNFTNHFYCAWTDFDDTLSRVHFNRSTDLLDNFSNPIIISNNFGQGTNVQTGPNGEVYICWADYTDGNLPAQNIGFAISNDGGQNFNSSLPFSYNGIRVTNNANPDFGNTRINDYPAMAVDRSCGPFRGNIYLVYPEFDANNNAVIQLRISSDNGNSFSNAITISNSDLEQAFFPWVACAPITGIVTVVYHGIEENSTTTTNTFVAFSNDGGNSFNNIQVSDVSHQRAPIGHPRLKPTYAGDYIGIDIYDGIAFAAWADNRNGTWQNYVSKLDLRSIATNRVFSTSNDLVFNDFTFDQQNITFQGESISVLGESKVISNASVDLKANSKITLSPEMLIEEGSRFQAKIEIGGCQTPGFLKSIPIDELHTREEHSQTSLDHNISLYPNPASDYVTVELKNNDFDKIIIYNFFGRFIKTINIQEEQKIIKINIQDFSNGPYFLEFYSIDKILTKKLLVQK